MDKPGIDTFSSSYLPLIITGKRNNFGKLDNYEGGKDEKEQYHGWYLHLFYDIPGPTACREYNS